MLDGVIGSEPPKGGPQRIAVFTGNYVNIVDGVALTLNRMVKHFMVRGREVVVFGPEGPSRALSPVGEFVGLPSIPAPPQPEYRFALGMPRAARQRLESFRPEIIHLATPDLIGWWGRREGRRRKLPVVTSFHSNIVSYLQYVPLLKRFQGAGWRYFRAFYSGCDHIYVPTESMAQELRERGIGQPREHIGERLRLWPRGVDLQRFSPKKRNLAWRRELGVADDERLVLFVARLRWEKGLDTLAKAIRALEDAKIPHRSMIVGDGVAYEPLRKRLPKTLFTGMLDGEALARAYASADLFLYPSATETFGNVILEAMASGLPVVAADAPGSRSVVAPGESALLAMPDDARSFFARAKEILQDDALREALAAAGLARSARFSWEQAMDGLLENYRSLTQLA